MIEIKFSNDHSPRQRSKVMTVLKLPRLWIPTAADYPRHDEWLDKTESEIADGTRGAMLGCSDHNPVGAIIYRRHKTQGNVVELRNISISPSVRGRLFGAFMLRQVEVDVTLNNEFVGIDTFSVDTKVTNTGMIGFLESQGYSYTLADIADLYHDGTGDDVTLTKLLI
jgi:ribosomal protein S18 acetylase RimI-like enzyme